MYLGVDVGGTKTLVACLDEHGIIREQERFATPRGYVAFLTEMAKCVANFSTNKFTAAGVGIPGEVNRSVGLGVAFGNLDWRDVPIQADLERIAHCPVVVENDAKLGGLSEALLVKDKYQRVLYITLGTGIGVAFVDHGQLDLEISDFGGKTLLIEHQGKVQAWETFASGKAITRRFGKRASEINDPKIWRQIAHDLAAGIVELMALLQPDVIILGGGVSTYFDRFSQALIASLKKYETPLLPIPQIQQAVRPEQAVLYGCYYLAKRTYEKSAQ